MSLDEVLDVGRAVYRCAKSLSARARFGSAVTIGILIDQIPDQVALTIALRETFALHTPAPHLRESTAADERTHRENIELLRRFATGSPGLTYSADQRSNSRRATPPLLRKPKA